MYPFSDAWDSTMLHTVSNHFHQQSVTMGKQKSELTRWPAVREAGRKTPPFPSIFFKPSTTIHDHGVNVVIPKVAQDDQADYEGELVRSKPHYYRFILTDLGCGHWEGCKERQGE